MCGNEDWSKLLEDSLQALLSMEPNRIQQVEQRFAECPTRDRTQAVSAFDASILPALKLTHAAAVRAAQLWRGSVPQPGYSADGPMDEVATEASLSVTG